MNKILRKVCSSGGKSGQSGQTLQRALSSSNWYPRDPFGTNFAIFQRCQHLIRHWAAYKSAGLRELSWSRRSAFRELTAVQTVATHSLTVLTSSKLLHMEEFSDTPSLPCETPVSATSVVGQRAITVGAPPVIFILFTPIYRLIEPFKCRFLLNNT
jgi:hypothetical protein